MNNADREYLEKNLSEEAKADAKRLSPKELLYLSIQINAIYNLSCVKCKQKMVLEPAKIKNIDDFCDDCQDNQLLINCFKRLEILYKKRVKMGGKK